VIVSVLLAVQLVGTLQALALIVGCTLMWGWLHALARFEFTVVWSKRFTFMVAISSLFMFGLLFAKALALFHSQ
jgi:hypothetical protein